MDGEKDVGKKTWRREREIYIYNIEREESKRRPLLGGVAVELAINQNEFRRWELFMTGLIGHLVETPLWTVSLLFLLRCTINTIAVKNRDSRKIQTVSRAHDSLYRYGYNILSISEENSYVLPPPPPSFLTPRLHKLSEQDIFRVEFSSSFGNSTSLSLYSLREYEKTGEETGFVAPFNLRPIRIKVQFKKSPFEHGNSPHPSEGTTHIHAGKKKITRRTEIDQNPVINRR